jgi:hypothetical protein
MFGGSDEPTPLDSTSTLGGASRGDAAALHQLFAKSLDPRLDGEYAETHSYDLDRVLFELGDARFAAALRLEPQRTRDKVLWDMQAMAQGLFQAPTLRYPQTESLCSRPDLLRQRAFMPPEV